MTPERMREIREWFGPLPLRSLARCLRQDRRSLRQMEDGTRPITSGVARWLASLEEWQEKNPPPEKTR